MVVEHGNKVHYEKFCKSISQIEQWIIDDNSKLLMNREEEKRRRKMLRGE